MPRKVVALIAIQRGLYGSTQIATVWKMTPICVLRCIKNERNDGNLEDCEQTLDGLRSFFSRTLFPWGNLLCIYRFSLHNFLLLAPNLIRYFSSITCALGRCQLKLSVKFMITYLKNSQNPELLLIIIIFLKERCSFIVQQVIFG